MRAGWRAGIGRGCRSRSCIFRGRGGRGAFLGGCCCSVSIYWEEKGRWGEKVIPQVIKVAELFACFTQHLDALLEWNPRHFSGLGELELVDVVCAADKLGLLLEPAIQLLEDEQHEVFQHAHDLVVVLLELHLQIQARELGQVARGI